MQSLESEYTKDLVPLFDQTLSEEDELPTPFNQLSKIISSYPTLKDEEQKKLFVVLRDTSSSNQQKNEARDNLVLTNLRLVVSEARKHVANFNSSSGVELMTDLIHEGVVHLTQAVDDFSLERGNKFSTFAVWRIRGGIGRYIENNKSTIRIPAAVRQDIVWVEAAVFSLLAANGESPSTQQIINWIIHNSDRQDPITERRVEHALKTSAQFSRTIDLNSTPSDGGDFSLDEKVGTPLPEDIILEDRVIDHLLSKLTARQKKIVELRWGLNGEDSKKILEIAAVVGKKRSTINNEKTAAIQIIKQALAEEFGITNFQQLVDDGSAGFISPFAAD